MYKPPAYVTPMDDLPLVSQTNQRHLDRMDRPLWDPIDHLRYDVATNQVHLDEMIYATYRSFAALTDRDRAVFDHIYNKGADFGAVSREIFKGMWYGYIDELRMGQSALVLKDKADRMRITSGQKKTDTPQAPLATLKQFEQNQFLNYLSSTGKSAKTVERMYFLLKVLFDIKEEINDLLRKRKQTRRLKFRPEELEIRRVVSNPNAHLDETVEGQAFKRKVLNELVAEIYNEYSSFTATFRRHVTKMSIGMYRTDLHQFQIKDPEAKSLCTHIFRALETAVHHDMLEAITYDPAWREYRNKLLAAQAERQREERERAERIEANRLESSKGPGPDRIRESDYTLLALMNVFKQGMAQ